jgi:hypothetical protein
MIDQALVENDIKMTGDVTIVRTDQSGVEVERREIKNLVVTVGKNFIASRMVGTTAAVMSTMSIGSGSSAASASNTSLEAVLGNATGVNFTAANADGTNSVTYIGVFPAGTGTGTVFEAGVFNGAPSAGGLSGTDGGTMLCRTTFPIVTKQAGDSIAITWVVTVN